MATDISLSEVPNTKNGNVNIKKKEAKNMDQNKEYILDLRGGKTPHREGKAAAVDFYCPEDVTLNMPWCHMGRGHINLRFGVQLPPNIGLDIRSRSGFSNKGMELDVAFFNDMDEKVGYMTHVRADVDVVLGLVDEDYKGDVGALYKVNSDRYMPTAKSEFELNEDYSYYTFVIPRGTRVCQGAFRKAENLEYKLGSLDMSDDRGGGYGHGGSGIVK